MDGFSVEDLINMPEFLQREIVRILNNMERGDDAAAQLSKALALSAKKSATSQDASQTRPLIILPMLYRAYAITRAGEILKWLASWAPEEVKGFLRQRAACDSWQMTVLAI